jgi:hypothetical protein
MERMAAHSRDLRQDGAHRLDLESREMAALRDNADRMLLTALQYVAELLKVSNTNSSVGHQ